MKSKTNTFGNICGVIAIILIQSSTLPVTYDIWKGINTNIPPLNMVLLVWSGILFHMIRSIIQKDTIHLISNLCGLITQSLLLSLIVFK